MRRSISVRTLHRSQAAVWPRALTVGQVAPAPVTSLAEAAALLRLNGALYLRYDTGRAPEATQSSRDGESGCLLPGLGVTPLRPEPWWDKTVEQWMARQLCQFAHLWGGAWRGWVVTGAEVGRGPDCEPLLGDVRTVGELCPECLEEASLVYRGVLAHGR
jgi:Family of unknown function (DUF6098)